MRAASLSNRRHAARLPRDSAIRRIMSTDWRSIFDRYAAKRVTRTDKAKGAYVPTKEQCETIESAGIAPARARPAPGFPVTVLFESNATTVEASYYYSQRSEEANRTPEPRMGHAFISSWLNVGDHVVIGAIGAQLFAFKLGMAPGSTEAAAHEVATRAARSTVFERARRAKGQPARRIVQRDDFVRNPYVVQAAILRSGGKCEMPGCNCALFERDNGMPYLEVHHITPLAERGDDTLENAAALCPHCHRRLHFGKDRLLARAQLAARVSALPAI